MLTNIFSRSNSQLIKSATSIDALESLQQENSALRDECALLQETTEDLAAKLEMLESSTSCEGEPDDSEIALLRQEVSMLHNQLDEAKKLQKKARADERAHIEETKKLREELESAHQLNVEAINHANESQGAREEMAQEILRLSAQIEEGRRHRDQLNSRENEMAEILAGKIEEISRLKNELEMTQQLNLTSSSRLHELKRVHGEEVEALKTMINEGTTQNEALNEKLRRQEEYFREEKEELCKLLVEAREEQSSSLEDRLQRQEQDFRAEKEELCNMLKEAEEHYNDKVGNLQAEIMQRQEVQRKLEEEIDNLESLRKQDKETASKLNAEFAAAEAKQASLEEELEKSRLCMQTDQENFVQKLTAMEKEHSTESKKVHTQLVLAQEAQREMKAQMSQIEAEHAKEKEEMMAELSLFRAKEADEQKWQEQLQTAKSEAARLKEALTSAEAKYREEIRELREELFWTQESEKQLKSEISEIESSHAEEMERLNTEAFDDCNRSDEEMAMLREKMEMQEQATREEKEELCNMIKAAEENYRQEVARLNEEISKLQESHRQLKMESGQLQAAHAEELEKMMTKTLDYCQKDAEIDKLKGKLQTQEEKFREEKERLREWLRKHLDDVRDLKDEFVKAQEFHIKHLLHVLAELERMETARNEEMSSVICELEIVKQEKDAAIELLSTEMELKQGLPSLGLSPELPTIMEASEISADDISELEARLEKHASNRTAHSNDFNATLHKLQMVIKPDNLKYIMKKAMKKQDANLESKVFTEIHRMSVALGELYTMEERAQQMLHEDIVSLMERLNGSCARGEDAQGSDENREFIRSQSNHLLLGQNLRGQLEAAKTKPQKRTGLDPAESQLLETRRCQGERSRIKEKQGISSR